MSSYFHVFLMLFNYFSSANMEIRTSRGMLGSYLTHTLLINIKTILIANEIQ